MIRRFLWLATLAATLAATAAIAIVLLRTHAIDLSTGLNLALQTVSAVAAIVGILLTIHLARREHRGAQREMRVAVSPHSGGGRAPEQARSQTESLAVYVRQMTAHLRAIGADPVTFVKLSAAADRVADQPRRSLRPRLAWIPHDEHHAMAEPEQVDLFDVHDRFERAVLLGEPGSGKSTCLQQLALMELEQLERGEPPDDELLLPLYVPLSEWTTTGLRAQDFLQHKLGEIVGVDNYYAFHFDHLLANGNFLLLLDGLNELPGRRSSSREGATEHAGGDHGLEGLAPKSAGTIDPRERSLRALAQAAGVQSKFILSCRGHEYYDSLQWQIVRVLPMALEQIEEFSRAYLPAGHATALCANLRANADLRGIATNPFFLRSITRVYTPDRAVASNRGAVLTFLYQELVEREGATRGPAEISEEQVTKTVGRVAFRMLKSGKIGNRVALRGLREHDRAVIDVLTDTGLVVARGGEVFFYHQIIQEFFAAQALCQRAVHARPKTLLADKRWSEVIALWLDLAPPAVQHQVISGLRARNLPWRRPWSYPNTTLAIYGTASTAVAFGVAVAYLFTHLLWPLGAVRFPWAWPADHALALLVIALAVRYPWRCLVPHRAVIANSAYVLSIRRTPEALPVMVTAFRRLFRKETLDVAQSLGRFGGAAVPHAVSGLTRKPWRIRVGCVFALGEIVRQHDSTEPIVIAPLLAVTTAGDPQLAGPLITALRYCRDPSVQEGIAEVIEHLRDRHPMMATFLVQPVSDWSKGPETAASPELTARLFQLADVSSPPQVRLVSLRAIGALRLPESVERLQAVANKWGEPLPVRRAAVGALGMLRTVESMEATVDLGERHDELRTAAADAIRLARDRGVLSALDKASQSWSWEVRQAAAVAVGRLGTVEALPILLRLASDSDEDVRAMSAHALGVVGLSGGLPTLERLVGDPHRKVRIAALASLSEGFPDVAVAILMRLSSDASCKERLRVIRLLGHRVGVEVEEQLRELAGDIDPDVRDTARAELERATAARHGRRVRTHFRRPFQTFKTFVSDELQLPALQAMAREERLSGTPDAQVWNSMQAKILADAELTRKYRRAFTAVLIAFYGALAIAGVIALGVVWLLASLAGKVGEVWLVAALLCAIAALTFAPIVRNLRFVPRLGAVIAALRVAAASLVFVLAIGAVVYVWWIVLLLMVLAGTVVVLAEVRRRRLRASDVARALDSAEPRPVSAV